MAVWLHQAWADPVGKRAFLLPAWEAQLDAMLRAAETPWGIAVAGLVHPDITDSQLFELRASKVSGDWRPINGLSAPELVGLLSVNVGGFEQAIAASAGDDEVHASGSPRDPGNRR